MKKITHTLLAIVITLAMLAAAPVITARADCTENTTPDPDAWTCSGADTDGLTTDDATDTVTVDSTGNVTNSLADTTTIDLTDGMLANEGSISNDETSGVAIYALGGSNITNNGNVIASGAGGTSIFTASGDVVNTGTVTANEEGSTAIITIFGNVTNDGTVLATGEDGTGIITDAGNNTVTNNGNIFASGVDGIAIVTGSGNDTVTLNSGSTTSGDTTAIHTGDNDNDKVVVNDGATINGIIDGGILGNDILGFGFYTQSQLNMLGLAASGGTLIYNGQTYTWINFETLLGLFSTASTSEGDGKRKRDVFSGPRIFFKTETALGVESDDHLGIDVFAKPGLIAFIPFSALGSIDAGVAGTRFEVPNQDHWYVVAINLGAFEADPDMDLYRVLVYDADGKLISDLQQFPY